MTVVITSDVVGGTGVVVLEVVGRAALVDEVVGRAALVDETDGVDVGVTGQVVVETAMMDVTTVVE